MDTGEGCRVSVDFTVDPSGTPYPHMVMKELRELLENLPKNEVRRILVYLKDWNDDRAGHKT